MPDDQTLRAQLHTAQGNVTRVRLATTPLLLLGGAVGVLLGAGPARAQTDYYNTDAGRPLRIEDAYALERRALELQVAPLRLERGRRGVYRWAAEPELAIGFLPRTHAELGLPFAVVDRGAAGSVSGLAGIELGVLHTLNAETSLPALAVAAELYVPAGGLAGDQSYGTLKGMLTRTRRWARLHLNAEYTLGAESRESADAASPGVAPHASRWLAGAALDRAFPLRSMLLAAELHASRPLADAADTEWTAGTGVRYQLTPRWVVDAGVGRRFTGDDPAWYLTFGSAVAVGIPWRPRHASRPAIPGR